ncbi:MAG: ABC transporter permease, partial [Candidatus Aenigmarchaeota archaeon]|nr:ABC transporter permease [Candidatus Aenigmarchaeota archaeon]
QIQNIEQDEVKFQKAYMGMVLIHGDIIESIPTITSTDGLEYRVTSAIRKMNNKISALIRLKDRITLKLFLSSSLQVVGPYMNIAGLSELPGRIEHIVNKLNDKNYDKLSFSHLDPSMQKDYEKEAELYDILSLQWNDFTDRQGKTIQADKGYAGIVIGHGEKSEMIRVIHVQRVPIFGTLYQLADLEELEKTINETIENVIDINEEIGYLADHGARPLSGEFQMPGQPGKQESLSTFNKLLSEDYTLKQVSIKESGIPEALSFLIIAGVRENFSEHELYQIDQFLMKGNNLAIFMDAFNEVMLQNQQPYYLPLNTGLEKMLKHYGLNVRKSYILDKSSFKQRIPRMFGGGERPIYYAPIIKGLVVLKASPVEIDEQRVEEYGLKATRLISSSEQSWEMSERVNLNPMYIRPPVQKGEFRSRAIAYMLEGSFPSYFADKPVPEKKDEENNGG